MISQCSIASATIPATTSLALLLHYQLNFYMSKAFNDLLIIIYKVTQIENVSGNCILFHHCFISVCTNPSSKRRLDSGKYTSFIVICWTKCSDMQHLCIASDFSPDLMFFALLFFLSHALPVFLQKCKQPFISYTNRHAFSSNLY